MSTAANAGKADAWALKPMTARLVLSPVGPEHTAELVQLHGEPHVAHWLAEP